MLDTSRVVLPNIDGDVHFVPTFYDLIEESDLSGLAESVVKIVVAILSLFIVVLAAVIEHAIREGSLSKRHVDLIETEVQLSKGADQLAADGKVTESECSLVNNTNALTYTITENFQVLLANKDGDVDLEEEFGKATDELSERRTTLIRARDLLIGKGMNYTQKY